MKTNPPIASKKMRKMPSLVMAILIYGAASIIPAHANGPLKPNYSRIFSEEIYDQSRLTPGLRYEERAILELYRRKEEALTKAFSLKLEPTVKKLKENLDAIGEGSVVKPFLDILDGIILTAKYVPQINEFYVELAKVVSGLARVGYKTSIFVRGGQSFQLLIPSLIKEVQDLQLEMEAHQSGLRDENVTPEEVRYVKLKNKLHPALQQSIEQALIKARGPEPHMFSPIDYVRQALSLPLSCKNLREIESFDQLRQRFDATEGTGEFFTYFGPELREAIFLVMKQMYFDSAPETHIGQRKSYYFYGNPGVGKSAAAKKIGEFLGLPTYEFNIGGKASVQPSEVTGASWLMPSSTPGLTADVFLKSRPRLSFKNTILIINDPDRLLFGNPQILKFFMNLLDPATFSYDNLYFNAPIDWSKVVVILTGNNEVPGPPQNPAEQDTYGAFRERLTSIHFPGFTPAQLNSRLLILCEQYRKKYCTITDETNQQIVDSILNEYRGGSLREGELRLDNKILSLLSLDPVVENVADNQSNTDENAQETGSIPANANEIDPSSLSRHQFLISGSYYAQRLEKHEGVVTLCFSEDSPNAVSLIFEGFFPNTSREVSLRTLRFARGDGCCGRENSIQIEGDLDTLRKTKKITTTESFVTPPFPTFKGYASWILPNVKLIEAIRDAESEQTKLRSKKPSVSYNAVTFVCRIMRSLGLTINFRGWQISSVSNLKSIVDSTICPKPDYTERDLNSSHLER